MRESGPRAERLEVDPTIKAFADVLAQQFTLASCAEHARQQWRALTPPTPEDLPCESKIAPSGSAT